MLDSLTTVVSICEIAMLPIFLPICLTVLWILLRKADFKSSTAYTVIFTIGVLDCFHMTTSFLAGLINLVPAFEGVFGQFKIGSCARNGYLLAVPLLEFMLAINRLTVILRVHGSDMGRVVLRITVSLLALVPIPTLYIMDIIDENIEFSYHEGTYRYTGPAYFEKSFIFSRVLMVVSTLAAYAVTVCVIVFQQNWYGSKFKLSKREFRFLLQALFQSLPLAMVILSGAFLYREIWKHGLFYLLWSLTSINLPIIHLIILVGFNSNVRKHLLNTVCRRKQPVLFKASARRISNVTSISVKSLAQL